MSKEWTRRSALALMGSGAGLLTWGTGGFTDVTADRQVNIDTTADDSSSGPLVGVETKTSSGGPGETVSLIELTNNLGVNINDVSANVEIKDSNGNIVQPDTLFKGGPNNILDIPDTIATESTESIKATLDTLSSAPADSDNSTYDVTLDVSVATKNDNQKVTLERASTVTYDDPRLSYWDFATVRNPSPCDDNADDGTLTTDIWSGNNVYRERDFSGFVFCRRKFEFRRDYDYEPIKETDETRGSVLGFGGEYSSNTSVLTAGDSDQLDFTGGFSLSVWIYSTGQNNFARLFSKWDSGTEKGYQFFLTGSDNLGIETAKQTGKYITTDVSVASNQWSHVVWTHRSENDEVEDRVYLNGTERRRYKNELGDPIGSDEPLRIGNGIDDDDNLIFPFNGLMDEPKAYDTALTTEQVKSLYETSKDGDGGSIGG
ncbi:LamG domain-containing protein [Haloarcula sp. CBA1130]|uniref:LamG domain-containing protein n=1 Tax=unclassified Haloarcula TaxID=2624677 RepID=UPI0012458676|nr:MULTISPECIES: LamG domain-containing protein [unclassified Haloarcula]KAA9399210.1 LamG domain-containing protein [Haloarcula sp. CBA1129]KAA9403724.1 LamG domain-containing protein [Haloarcula sp. CBA1130]